MPRKYIKRPGCRTYASYNEEDMNKAINAVMEEGVSVNRAAELFQVKRETLRNKVKGLHTMKKLGQTVFTVEEEESLATCVAKCAEW